MRFVATVTILLIYCCLSWGDCRRMVVQRQLVKEVITPVLATTFLAVPVAVPAYGAGYNPSPTEEIVKLREEIQKLQKSLGQPPPGAMAAREKPAHVSLLQVKCFSCHGADSSAVKGKGFAIFDKDSNLKKLSAEEIVNILRRTRDDKHGVQMPKGSKPLSDEEYSVLLGLMDQ